MEKDYSDIEVLYGKPSVTTEEVYEAMMDTANEWSRLGNEIWEKENPVISGMSADYIKANPTSDDYDKLSDIEARLWQMCHQLIHNILVSFGEKMDDDTYAHRVERTSNKMDVKFLTSASEGQVWFEFDNDVCDDDEVSLETLFELAQDIYCWSKGMNIEEIFEFA